MTPNNMTYGDIARYPLYINAYVRAVRYWLKITRMNEKRLPYKACLMLLHLDEQGKKIITGRPKFAQHCLDLVVGSLLRTSRLYSYVCALHACVYSSTHCKDSGYTCE